MSQEFKCPYCEGTASIAYHRAGDNVLYCQDCKKAFSERDAKIIKLNTRIAELKAERDRLRKALERVVKLLDRPMLKDDMCLYMDKAIRVARKALEGAGE